MDAGCSSQVPGQSPLLQNIGCLKRTALRRDSCSKALHSTAIAVILVVYLKIKHNWASVLSSQHLDTLPPRTPLAPNLLPKSH